MREFQVARGSLTVSEFPDTHVLFIAFVLDDAGASEQMPLELICSRKLCSVIATKYLSFETTKYIEIKGQKISSQRGYHYWPLSRRATKQ